MSGTSWSPSVPATCLYVIRVRRSMSLYRPQAEPRYSPVGSKAPVNPKSSIAVRYVPPVNMSGAAVVAGVVAPLDPEVVGAVVPVVAVVVGPVGLPPLSLPHAAANSASTDVRAIAPISFRLVTFPPFWEDSSHSGGADVRLAAELRPSFRSPLLPSGSWVEGIA